MSQGEAGDTFREHYPYRAGGRLATLSQQVTSLMFNHPRRPVAELLRDLLSPTILAKGC